MPPFHVCIHDATPAFARESRLMIQELAPLLGRSLSLGVVPNWRGEWPLTEYPDYCRLLRDSSDELLLHGYFHRRARGAGPTTLLTGGSDEMNGLDREETVRLLDRGQNLFVDLFGEPARGFLPPGWQPGRVREAIVEAAVDDGGGQGLEHLLGFFSLEARDGRRVPLATWSWDCGRWGWLGHVGDGIGRLLQTLDRGVPTLAIHPTDLRRGFWPRIVGLVRELMAAGYEPRSIAALLETRR